VNKDALESIAVWCGARNHIDAFDKTEVKILECGHNALSGDVGKHSRNA
jgi:hypothetical protein